MHQPLPHHPSLRRWTASLLTAVALAACSESESLPTEPGGGTANTAINNILASPTINASASDTLVYFSFADNAVVPSSATWDIALRRYEVRLNGGVSGTGGVTGYSLGNNRSLTGPQVLALTADNTLAAFDSVRAAQIPVDSLFQSDRLVANGTAFLNLAGAPTANATAYWKVRTASGAFSLMRVSAITMSPAFALTSVTFEVRPQTGTALGAPSAFTVPIGTVPVNVSLTTGAAVTVSGCNWDVLVTPQTFAISVNSACNVATYPGPTAPAFAGQTSASDAPQYAAFLASMAGPIPNSITDVQAPFRYNLAGTNRLDPAFNTYLVKTATRVYKLQVIGYYNASGASGYPTLRYSRIR